MQVIWKDRVRKVEIFAYESLENGEQVKTEN